MFLCISPIIVLTESDLRKKMGQVKEEKRSITKFPTSSFFLTFYFLKGGRECHFKIIINTIKTIDSLHVPNCVSVCLHFK